MNRFKHESVFQCPADNCGETWCEIVSNDVYLTLEDRDCSGMPVKAEACPLCGHKDVDGEILSEEDLDFDENMRASVIEGRSDQETGR